MNTVVMIAVLSVANSSMYGATRTLQALAEQGQAPRLLAFTDRKGRPLVCIGIAIACGLTAYLYVSPVAGQAFTWMLALSGLSSVFTWSSICYAHIQFRKAWNDQGFLLSDLVYQSPIGAVGSWVGLIALLSILVAQLWVALDPVGGLAETAAAHATNFFEAYLAFPVVLCFYAAYKFWYRTKWVRTRDVDLVTGRDVFEGEVIRGQSEWPRWKVWYKTLC